MAVLAAAAIQAEGFGELAKVRVALPARHVVPLDIQGALERGVADDMTNVISGGKSLLTFQFLRPFGPPYFGDGEFFQDRRRLAPLDRARLRAQPLTEGGGKVAHGVAALELNVVILDIVDELGLDPVRLEIVLHQVWLHDVLEELVYLARTVRVRRVADL